MGGKWRGGGGIWYTDKGEMVDVIRETALIPGSGSEQHPPLTPSLYSQISLCL